MLQKTYIVIGAGSSSIAFCSAILEHEDNEVIVIHEGSENHLLVKCNNYSESPARWAHAAVNSKYSRTAYINENTTMRKVSYLQGGGVGGSSNVNAMIWSLGDLGVFDRFWPLTWNSKRIESLNSRLLESLNLAIINAHGGIDQLLQRSNRLCKNSCRNSYLSTTMQLNNLSSREDLNTGQATDQFQKVRTNITDQLLKKHTNKIQYHSNTKVLYIEFDEAVAVGVRLKSLITGVETSLRLDDISSNGEIILCAGVFESPRILYDSFRYNRLLYPLQHENFKFVNVNERCHLQDHVLLPLIFMGNWWTGLQSYGMKSLKNDDGPANGIHGWIYLDEKGNQCAVQTSATETAEFSASPCVQNEINLNSEDMPLPSMARIQLVFVDGRFCLDLLPDMILPHFDTEYAPFYTNHLRPSLAFIIKLICGLSLIKWLSSWLFGTLICLVRPFSTGKLRFENSDGQECKSHNKNNKYTSQSTFIASSIRTDLGHFEDVRDVDIMTNGLKAARNVISATHGLWYIEVFPGPALLFLAQEVYIRFYSSTYFHACGTCPMANGQDDIQGSGSGIGTSNALDVHDNSIHSKVIPPVVDENLRVIGVQRLRIADASVIPVGGIPSAPIASVCMTIGLAAAEYVIKNET